MHKIVVFVKSSPQLGSTIAIASIVVYDVHI